MVDHKQNLLDMARTRVGALALVVAAAALALAVMFFSSTDLVIMQLDFSGDEDIFGWVSIAISFGSAGVALMLALMTKSD